MEIEFIEHPAEASPPVPPPAAPRPPGTYLGLLAVGVLGAAAALAAVAPFQRLYRVRIVTRGFSEVLTSDGWGRMGIVLTGATSGPEHSGRYGIVLLVLAALCTLLAVAAAVPVARSAAVHAATVAGAVVAGGALATAGAMMWLDATSTLDNARSVADEDGADTIGEHVALQAGYGPAVWLVLGAAACAIGAAAVIRLRGRLARRAPGPVAPAVPVPPALAGPELGEPLTW